MQWGGCARAFKCCEGRERLTGLIRLTTEQASAKAIAGESPHPLLAVREMPSNSANPRPGTAVTVEDVIVVFSVGRYRRSRLAASGDEE
jgi:hypothetical protein